MIHVAKTTNAVVYAVDHFLGSPGERTTDHLEAAQNPLGIIHEFYHNISYFDVCGKVVPLTMPSNQAIKYFQDWQVDVIFIDGSHDYSSAREDIGIWWDVVVPGGIMCGDDYNWPGVTQAVHEFFVREPIEVSIEDKYWEVKKGPWEYF